MTLFEAETASYRKTPLPPAYRVAGATGSMARDKTSTSARPVVVQVVPLSTERKTPLPPAYMVVGVRLSIAAYRVPGVRGSMTRDMISPSARPVAVQVAPLLTEWKTPLSVPAYRVVGTLGLMAREVTYPEAPAKPVFSAVQWFPSSVERKMSSLVLAYRVLGVTGSMAREKT